MITKDTKMDIDATVEEKPFSDQLRWLVGTYMQFFLDNDGDEPSSLGWRVNS